MTEMLTKSDVELFPYNDDGKDRLTHIVHAIKNRHLWQPGMKAQDIVDLARMTGQEVVALCDYRWVPLHDPDKYPVCEDCMKIAQTVISAMG